jgi:ATP-dependent DNA helicase RecG
MEQFKNGELDAIVATTVIEVGVNIPNATTIVILDPARFGISQLHQLRGRVGRGTIASQCVMIGRGKTPDARRRLTALCDTTDGFVLSEIDLDLRGHGSLFGTNQSGMTDLKIADLREDKKILSYAQTYAHTLLHQEPDGTETLNWVAEAEYFLHPEMLEWLNKS